MFPWNNMAKNSCAMWRLLHFSDASKTSMMEECLPFGHIDGYEKPSASEC